MCLRYETTILDKIFKQAITIYDFIFVSLPDSSPARQVPKRHTGIYIRLYLGLMKAFKAM